MQEPVVRLTPAAQAWLDSVSAALTPLTRPERAAPAPDVLVAELDRLQRDHAALDVKGAARLVADTHGVAIDDVARAWDAARAAAASTTAG